MTAISAVATGELEQVRAIGAANLPNLFTTRRPTSGTRSRSRRRRAGATPSPSPSRSPTRNRCPTLHSWSRSNHPRMNQSRTNRTRTTRSRTTPPSSTTPRKPRCGTRRSTTAVGLVEPAALERDPDAAEHLAQRAPARRALGQRVVLERLHHLEVLPARLAGVFVGRHASGASSGSDVSTLRAWSAKCTGLPMRVSAELPVVEQAHHGTPGQEGRHPRRRPRHPVPSRRQGPAQGDAAAGRQAGHPVRGRGGRRVRDHRHPDHHRPGQAKHGGPLRPVLRAGVPPGRGRASSTQLAEMRGHRRHGRDPLRAPGRAARAGPRRVGGPGTTWATSRSWSCSATTSCTTSPGSWPACWPPTSATGDFGAGPEEGHPGRDLLVRQRRRRTRRGVAWSGCSTSSRSPPPRRPRRTWASWAATC